LKSYQRYFLEVAYKGTNFNGWQVQRNTERTVQGILNEKLSILFSEKIKTQGSSRTDTGVHAKQNFAHFEVVNPMPDGFMSRVNFMLPDDIVVKNIIPVRPDCNVRFDAIGRSYEYILSYTKNPFNREFACYYPYKELPLEKLNEAAQVLFRHTDYAAFSKKRTQVKTSICYISRAEWKYNDLTGELTFYVSSNRFLRGMVRGLVATMLLVGRNKLSLKNFEKNLESLEAHKTDFSAPANGLTLTEVRYPDGYFG
jgi:tRNA pseudouridine38-40 synthase